MLTKTGASTPSVDPSGDTAPASGLPVWLQVWGPQPSSSRLKSESAHRGPEGGRVRADKVVPEGRMLPQPLGPERGDPWPDGRTVPASCITGVAEFGLPLLKGVRAGVGANSHVGEVGMWSVCLPAFPLSRPDQASELGFPQQGQLPTDLISLLCVWSMAQLEGPAWRGTVCAAAGQLPVHLLPSPAGHPRSGSSQKLIFAADFIFPPGSFG